MDRVEFHFDPMGTTEDLERYCPGGYHPVVIGTLFDSGRYRILHKLGFGSYATVWLARDTQTNTYVALKISTAESSTSLEAQEARMLRKLAGNDHILSLHETFTIDGPNGKHSVLVTEGVAPLLVLARRSPSPRWRKAAARGLVHGVAQMHRCGVKHGDLHIGNLWCAMPELARQDEDDLIQDLSPYDVTLVLPCDHAAQTPSLPPYVLPPCNLAEYCERIQSSDLPDVKILDFGNAREAHAAAGDLQCAVEACSPEVAFARVAHKESSPAWGLPTDVWAVGATIYEIVAGCALFYGVGLADGLLGRMAVLAGEVPASWRSYWDSRPGLAGYDVSREGAERYWAERRHELRKGCADDADADRLLALLRRVLVLDPEKRPIIEELAEDAWFQDSET